MIAFKTLKTVEHEGDKFSLIKYATLGEASLNSVRWQFGLVLEPDSIQDGCDVEELDELSALDIMGKLFNIHIYDNKTGVSRL